MKVIILSILVFITTAGCDILNPGGIGNLTASFCLTDTTGRAVTTFRSGEQFVMLFSLINNTEDTITYYRGSRAPPVTFQIIKEDSIVATSVDGYTFVHIVLGGSLAPGDTLKGYWKAPTTPAQSPKVVLKPSTYVAKVVYPSFNRFKVNPVPLINFSVIE